MAIFGSKDPAPQPKPPAPRSEAQGGPRATIIGANIVIDGTLSGNENVIVEGAIRGKIQLESDLRIGSSARVEALVHAKNVMIEGVLVGDVSADARVELLPSAKVDGNIKAPKIVVAEGAKFKGAVDMGGQVDKGTNPQHDSKEKAHVGNRDEKQK
jgi:cytoskeletal protein CcmA (bactofilin family)